MDGNNISSTIVLNDSNIKEEDSTILATYYMIYKIGKSLFYELQNVYNQNSRHISTWELNK